MSNKICRLLCIFSIVFLAASVSGYILIQRNFIPNSVTVTRGELDTLNFGDYNVISASVINSDEQHVQVGLGKFPLKKVKVKVVDEKSVHLGGVPIGFTIFTKGVIIIGISDVKTESGYVKAVKDADIKTGDVLISLAETEVNSAKDIDAIINQENLTGKPVKAVLIRKGNAITTEFNPALDEVSNKYKLGLWIRDSAAGVGTLTYVKQDKRFGALGHPIADVDTRTILPVNRGDVYNCSVVGVQKSERGSPGEIKGVFLKSGKTIGTLDKNNRFGVFGTIEKIPKNGIYENLVPVSTRNSVKPGKATIVTTIGGAAGEYEIEIIKTNYQKTSEEKSMVIKITDKRLLEKTGGIVQGMSGSPIIQGGKLVGAVTHVFINDATKGFGVYLDWMYDE